MKRHARSVGTFLAACALGAAALAQVGDAVPQVPSGQRVTFVERVAPGRQTDPGGMTYVEESVHFRFLAPAISREGGRVTSAQAAQDMLFLCQHFVLPILTRQGEFPASITISMADRPVAFGEAAPQATQFFEVFRAENGKCDWGGL